MSVSVLDGVREKRIHYRNKRAFCQLVQKIPNPETANRDRSDDVQPAYRERKMRTGVFANSRTRADKKIHIDETHEQNKESHHRKAFRLSLQVLHQKDQKRSRKVEKYQPPRHPAPASGRTLYEPGGLFRQVSGKDDQVLREIEVRPDHYESEHQFAEIVKMASPKDTIHRNLVRQKRKHDHAEAKTTECPANDEQQAPNRREPVRLEGHNPVDSSKGHDERVNHHCRTAKSSSSPEPTGRLFMIFRSVLVRRPL